MTFATYPPRDPAALLDTGPRQPSVPIAVSPHHLASAAGVEVMAAGGSGVDGAIAVNAVLGVVAPDTCGVGGDLFAIVKVPDTAAPLALNASGRAGAGARAEDLREAGHVEIPLRSPWSVTVPGCVDGWESLHARFGRVPFADLLAPAIALLERIVALPELDRQSAVGAVALSIGIGARTRRRDHSTRARRHAQFNRCCRARGVLCRTCRKRDL